jgi:ADP-ribose pyrophosphatase
MKNLQKWKLLSAEDVSPSPHMPVEKRSYLLPNGKKVDDFYVVTILDSVHVLPITKDGKVVMVRMYKQGVDKVIVQFPAGRMNPGKETPAQCGARELEEETGIQTSAEKLESVFTQSVMTTKSSERVHVFLLQGAEFNSTQNLDANEEIEVLIIDPEEVDRLIQVGEIDEGLMIADWYMARKKFPQLFQKTS